MFFQVQALGNVGKDPELTVTNEGTPLTKFTLAVNRKRGNNEDTLWLNCTAWRGLAETIERHVHKGDTLFIQGDFTPRQYITRDGKPGFSLDVSVEKFSFAGGSKPGTGQGRSTEHANEDPFLADLPDNF
jgi:single-strand DNA-binding protein